MLVFDRIIAAIVLVLASAPSCASAQEEDLRAHGKNRALHPPSMMAAPPIIVFKSETDAFITGLRQYRDGNKSGAVRALEYAATKGHPRALWKLGRMYADGDGVESNDLKAFEYFSQIADDFADVPPEAPNASFVANAFVTLGTYFKTGIADSYVKANPARAREMFHYAATYFRDPAAQFHLAQMYLDTPNPTSQALQAARWLNLSAEKGHHGAQALLGHMLISGVGVPRQAARGLMLLTIARDSADPVKDEWIVTMHDKAFASANRNDRQAALVMLEQYLRK